MGIIFSRQCEYAVQAIVYLAKKPQGEMTSIKEISNTLKIPYHFTAKILQDLVYEGLLSSLKGPTGGFGLARSAKEISLLNIVEAVDGIKVLNSCVMGFSDCGDNNPCAAHRHWKAMRDTIYKKMLTKTIAELAGAMKKKAYLGLE